MGTEMALRNVEATHAAVIRGRFTMQQIPAEIMPLVQRVWEFVRAGGVEKHGHNVWIYHHRPDGGVDVEVGVQVEAPFTATGDVVPTRTPGGRVAHAVYHGDYSDLPGVHRALRDWVTGQGLHETGDNWEVYGDMHEDPARRRTDVYHLLTEE